MVTNEALLEELLEHASDGRPMDRETALLLHARFRRAVTRLADLVRLIESTAGEIALWGDDDDRSHVNPRPRD